jgi:Motility quorum-sensing regulator, toxin of MqsA
MVARCYHLNVNRPTYPLELIKGLMRDGSWRLTESAVDAALQMGFDEGDIYACVVDCLEETHFYKTMRSEKNPLLMQDVYHITYEEHRVYVKLQVNVEAVVVSFKEK